MAATNRVLLHVTFNNELFFTTSAAHITPQPPPIEFYTKLLSLSRNARWTVLSQCPGIYQVRTEAW